MPHDHRQAEDALIVKSDVEKQLFGAGQVTLETCGWQVVEGWRFEFVAYLAAQTRDPHQLLPRSNWPVTIGPKSIGGELVRA